MIKVLLVDQHPIYRAGLSAVLRLRFPKIVLGHAANYRQAIEQLFSGKWNLVVSDLKLPDRSGLELVQAVRRLEPPVPVLVVSEKPVRPYGCRAVKYGAAGYLKKGASEEDFLRMAEQALNGKRSISAELALALADTIDIHEECPPHESLSDRELHVLLSLAQGQCVKEIASALALSPKTITTYRARLNEKLRTRTEIDLVRYCIEHRLIASMCDGCDKDDRCDDAPRAADHLGSSSCLPLR
jgi:DNA-binding NarL/FixJ family response regulator